MLKRFLSAAFLILAPTFGFGEGETAKPKAPGQPWNFSGLIGQHDIAQVQRGFQVYWARCAACHGMEFRRFWHLEKIGYAEDYIKNVLITEYYDSLGQTFNASNYSIENLPPSRVSGAPDLSHGVLAQGKTMEAGANYVYSLMLGYDRLNDAVKGKALQTDLSDADSPFTQVGEPAISQNEDGSPKSITTVFERDNFYLYEKDGEWFIRSYVDVRTDIEDFADDGTSQTQSVNSFRLDEASATSEAEFAAQQDGRDAPADANEAWDMRDQLHMEEVASWTAGLFYNPFKSGGLFPWLPPLPR